MRNNKLFKKFYIATVSSVIICLAFLLITLSFFVSNYLARDKKTLLSENCVTISLVIENSLDSRDFLYNMSNIVTVLGRAIDSDIFIAQPNGEVLICSCEDWRQNNDCIHTNENIDNNIMTAATSGEFYELGTLSGKHQAPYYTVGMPIYNQNGNVFAAVFASSPAATLTEFYDNLIRMFAVSSAIPIVLMFFVVYFITFKLTKPVRLMSDAARSLAKGDFSKRIPINGNDEINDLAVAFNRMTDSLVQLEGMRRSFVANVSHELKTPMTTISGFVDGILDGTINDDKREYYLSIVSSEVKRLSRLVQSMLSLAKLESGEMSLNKTVINLDELVCEIVISQEQRIEKKFIDINGLDSLEKNEIFADRDLLYQIVYNLVDNAVKFTNEGGYISFVAVIEDNNNISLKIRNSGYGITPKDLPYVFDRFYKTDKSRSANKESTGLGLYIAKTIIDLHGGKITVRSSINEYTEFEIILPKQIEKNLPAGRTESSNE